MLKSITIRLEEVLEKKCRHAASEADVRYRSPPV
jgi:hypothetical protein